MTRLFLVRHGETTFNEKKVYYGSTDCPLNQKGIRQAKKLQEILKNVKFDVVLASPLQRAVDSACIINSLSKEEITRDERLQEIDFGLWEGKSFEEIQEDDMKNWEEWCADWIHKSPPKGECFIEFYERVKSSIQERLDMYKNQTILLVSHQGCMRIIMTVLLHMNKESYWNFSFESGMYSLLEIQDGHCTIEKINSEVYP